MHSYPIYRDFRQKAAPLEEVICRRIVHDCYNFGVGRSLSRTAQSERMHEITMKQAPASQTSKPTPEIPKAVRPAEIEDKENTLGSRVATVAVIGLGAALIEVDLIPGMLIGAAAVLAPNFLPKLGNAMRPLLKTMMKAGFAFAAKTRESIAEAGEHFQDIMAEAKAESERDMAATPESARDAV